MKCPICGESIPDAARFCPRCGGTTDAPEFQPANACNNPIGATPMATMSMGEGTMPSAATASADPADRKPKLTNRNKGLLVGLGSALAVALVAVLAVSFATRADADVRIDEENFPDPVFRGYVEDNIDKNHDGKLSDDEIDSVTTVDVSNYARDNAKVSDLSGIGHFHGLRTLNASHCNMHSLPPDFYELHELRVCDVTYNYISETIDVTRNESLIVIYVGGNQQGTNVEARSDSNVIIDPDTDMSNDPNQGGYVGPGGETIDPVDLEPIVVVGPGEEPVTEPVVADPGTATTGDGGEGQGQPNDGASPEQGSEGDGEVDGDGDQGGQDESGEQGEPVDQGEAGEAGEAGDQGEAAEQGGQDGSGESGDQGEAGEAAEQDEAGEAAEQGGQDGSGEPVDQGEAGEAGGQDEAGDAGAQGGQDGAGEAGEPADQGESGEAVDQGEPADQGESGEAVDQGEPTDQAESGEAAGQGGQGESGESVDQGEAVEQGENGESGEAGQQEGQSEAGAQGGQGEAGEGGESGDSADQGDSGTASASESKTLYAYQENGKWGYVDEKDNVVIEAQYEDAMPYSEDVAAVRSGSTYRFVNCENAPVNDVTGAAVLPYSEGVAYVAEQSAAVTANGTLDAPGKFVKKDGTELAVKDLMGQEHLAGGGEFHGGYAPAKLDQSWGFIDEEGNWAVLPQYEQVTNATEMEDERVVAGVCQAGVWTYIDVKTGAITIEGQFVEATAFDSTGHAVVRFKAPEPDTSQVAFDPTAMPIATTARYMPGDAQAVRVDDELDEDLEDEDLEDLEAYEDDWDLEDGEYIDDDYLDDLTAEEEAADEEAAAQAQAEAEEEARRQAEEEAAAQAAAEEEARRLAEEEAAAQAAAEEEARRQAEEEEARRLAEEEAARIERTYVIIDAYGGVVRSLEGYGAVGPMHEGMAAACNADGVWGYVNSTGDEVITCTYKEAGAFGSGYAPVSNDDGKWCIIDKDGDVAFEPKYASMKAMGNPVKKDA